MASAVETQRLISVSLGKIAQSRAQRGGINLHKNLLVASVLNKARTAFMMENYSHQLSLQHKQQQQHQIILATPQPAPVMKPISPADTNSLSSHGPKTCQTTPDEESRSVSVDTPKSPELVNCASDALTTTGAINDKENISPSTENSSSSSAMDEDRVECKQDCLSGEQHMEAANQLACDAQTAGFNTSSCKQTSASTTCSGILKRRRDNPEAFISNESDCPASKKARISSSDCSFLQSCEISSSCEYESDCWAESDVQMSDSPQISNLVSIFNSGFSGLCPTSSSPASSYDCSYNSDNSSSHQWSNSRKVSDNQSLHCSSQVERFGSLSAAIVLSA